MPEHDDDDLDAFLREQMRDPEFAAAYNAEVTKHAGITAAIDVALQATKVWPEGTDLMASWYRDGTRDLVVIFPANSGWKPPPIIGSMTYVGRVPGD